MCGIVGWYQGRAGSLDLSSLASSQRAIHHRGPDDQGTFVDVNHRVALAHNRLSIIDLSENAHQPMINAANGDVLVFNGEIYNFRELRIHFEAGGHVFRSNSDTEVLLVAFQHWGIDCVRRIKGMFAFAVWSPRQNALFLARDPMGIKPLYYWTMPSDKGIVFASEIKAFLPLPGFERVINHHSLEQFIEFGYSCGEDTIFQGVSKLLPGTWMRIEDGRVVESAVYFEPAVPLNDGQFDPAGLIKNTYETLDRVVSEHLVADVPVGILLSGGLDSGLIASLAARHSPIQTFTMGFAESKVDERPFARVVSEFVGSHHHELEITPLELTEDLEQNVRFFDDLFGDWGMISTRLLYRKCREQGIKVVIVGEGADELFGGYNVFRNALPAALRGPRRWRLFQLYRQYAGRRYGRCFAEFARWMTGYLDESGGDWFHAIRMFETRNQLDRKSVV